MLVNLIHWLRKWTNQEKGREEYDGTSWQSPGGRLQPPGFCDTRQEVRMRRLPGSRRETTKQLERPAVREGVLAPPLLLSWSDCCQERVVTLSASQLHLWMQIHYCRHPIGCVGNHTDIVGSGCQSGILQEPVPGHHLLLGLGVARIGRWVDAQLLHTLKETLHAAIFISSSYIRAST